MTCPDIVAMIVIFSRHYSKTLLPILDYVTPFKITIVLSFVGSMKRYRFIHGDFQSIGVVVHMKEF